MTVLLNAGLDDHVLIPELNTKLREAGGCTADGLPYWELADISEGPWGGIKVPWALYGGACKSLDLEDLAQAVLAVPWSDRDAVQVIVNDEDPGRFRLLSLGDLAAVTVPRSAGHPAR